MSYAIITVGGKQYRVREGERLLVDRVALDDGSTFAPQVLLTGGEGGVAVAPSDVTVTARVVGHERGPKIRIGKYKKRTGYKRHAGFRAALTQIEIESIGVARRSRPTKAAEPAPAAAAVPAAAEPAEAAAGVPEGYDGLTIAALKAAAASWSAGELTAALEHERGHANRKGAVAALEAVLAAKEGEG